MPEVTAILLNWKREENVKKIICSLNNGCISSTKYGLTYFVDLTSFV